MDYGYIRVSSTTQNPDRQIDKMLSLGIEKSNLYIDKASGKDLSRPAYSLLLDKLQAGDLLVVDSLDRLGRNYDDVTREWRRLVSLGIDIQCLDLDFLDTRHLHSLGAIGICVEDMLLSLLAYVAQTEREKMLQRQREGIQAAKARGKKLGRKPREYPSERLSEARKALDSDGVTAASRILGCHRNTVYNLVREGRL